MIYSRRYAGSMFAFIMVTAFFMGIPVGYTDGAGAFPSPAEQAAESMAEVRDGQTERMPERFEQPEPYATLSEYTKRIEGVQLLPDPIHNAVETGVRELTAVLVGMMIYVGFWVANAGAVLGEALQPLPQWLVVGGFKLVTQGTVLVYLGYIVWELKGQIQAVRGV